MLVDRAVGWNEARPVPEGDRASCANSGLDTVSFPGRACLHLDVVAQHVVDDVGPRDLIGLRDGIGRGTFKPQGRLTEH